MESTIVTKPKIADARFDKVYKQHPTLLQRCETTPHASISPDQSTRNWPCRDLCVIRSPQYTPFTSVIRSCRLRSKAKLRGSSTVKDNELRLEENVAIDAEANPCISLDAAKAGAATGRCVDNVASGNDSAVGPNTKGDAGKSRRTREGITSLVGVVFRARDFGVVGRDNVAGKVEESRAGVGDGINGCGCKCTGANRIAVGSKLPEAIGSVHVDVGDGTGVLRSINVTKIIGSWRPFLQVHGEQRSTQRSFGIAEECLLLNRLNRVQSIKGEA